MKILLVSDKENDHIWDHFDPQRFKDVDLIISCGDITKISIISGYNGECTVILCAR